MARKTYEIRPRQQYDPDGARIECGRLCASYNADGSRSHGTLGPASIPAEVEAAMERVLETREAETVTVGEDEPADKVAAPARGPGWCDRCKSYCYGDCTAY